MGKAASRKRLMRTFRRAVERDAAKEEIRRGRGVAEALVASPQKTPGLSPWDAQPEARRDAIEGLDNFAHLRKALGNIAAGTEEWAGIPMPLEGKSLVIEPTYKFAALAKIGEESAAGNDEFAGAKLRNRFHSSLKGRDVYVYEQDGRIEWGTDTVVNHATMELDTLGCADAWGIEQESRAVNLLATLVGHRAFKQYMLTGMFLESSARSGVAYLFRRLRPTLALSTRGEAVTILCALCMHPIAYYGGSWAGAMCPTDDVVAHLMLMRGDEAMFWRRCNQHPAWRPEAGL